jgi:hypothetical protein
MLAGDAPGANGEVIIRTTSVTIAETQPTSSAETSPEIDVMTITFVAECKFKRPLRQRK